MEESILHIFTQHGKTYTFRGYYNLVANESVISFDYKAMSDGKTKHASFYVSNMTGWSYA